MAPPHKFLLIDADSHGRLFVSKTLLRHYPAAVVQECQDLDTAIGLVRELPAEKPRTVVIAHRTLQTNGHELVAALRAVHPTVPIVWMDNPEAARLAPSAGATRFLDEDAWLLIGTTVKDLL
jgi:DNA-binding NarL/FixJ family response regulator